MRSKLALAALALLAVIGLVFALPTPQGQPGASPAALRSIQAPSDRFVVRGARVFDGSKLHPHATVWVADGKIARVEFDDRAPVPADGPVVDGSGKTLLPGLIDTHTHTWEDGLERALVFGVTTQLDQFTEPGTLARTAREQAAGNVATRADLLSAGTLVTRAGGHGTQFGVPIPTLAPGASDSEIDAFIAARITEGSRWIKLVIEDGHEIGMPKLLPTLDEPTVRAVVAAAHRQKVLAVAHVHALDAARMAIAAGADGLVHTVVDAAPDAELAREIARRGAFVIPTLSVVGGPLASGARASGAGPSLADDPRLAPFLTRGEIGRLRAPELLASIPGGAPVVSQARASIAVLRAAGVRLLAGTDAANPGTTWGPSLHGELELLVGAGLSATEALAGATGLAADAFGLTDRGRIAVGRRADLLLVDGDPTVDVTATRAIVAVWKGGAALERAPHAGSSAPKLSAEGGVLANFDGSDTLPAGWMGSTDALRGGASVVELVIATDDIAKTRYLRIRGELKTGFPFPWAGAMLNLGGQPMAPVDLNGRTALKLRTRGTAGVVLVLAEGSQRPFVHALPESSTWTEHAVDLSALGVPTDAVGAILVSGGPGLGAFAIDVDDVGLWPPT